jgi:hypothetical protein
MASSYHDPIGRLGNHGGWIPLNSIGQQLKINLSSHQSQEYFDFQKSKISAQTVSAETATAGRM